MQVSIADEKSYWGWHIRKAECMWTQMCQSVTNCCLTAGLCALAA